jgi:1-acyl-sn-glycerol-3-phosphate acyltransferase
VTSAGAWRRRSRPVPGLRQAPTRFVGRQARRAAVVLGLLVILPGVAVAERLRGGAGRRFGRRGILVLSRLVGITYELEGDPASWPAARVVVANHSSLLDVPALLVVLPDARFLAAADLYRFPLLSSALRAMGCVPLDRRQPRQGRRQIAALAAARLEGTIVVFPEGSIPPEGRLRFKTGAFELAASAGVAVCPVAIVGTAAVLPPGHRLAVHPGRVRIRLLAPITPTGEPHARKGLRDRAEAAILVALQPV